MLDPSNYNVLVYPATLNTLLFRRSHKLQVFINSYLFKFVENPEASLPCADLLRQMQQARDACWEKTGNLLNLTLSGSDGGQSDENSGPENVLNHTWAMPVQCRCQP